MTIKDFERIDITTGELGKGDLFVGPEGQQVNLSGVNVLWSGTDTVRQLYQGVIDPHWYADIGEAYQSAPNNKVTLRGHTFMVKSGRSGGFKYLLQNNEIGVTLLVKGLYNEPDSPATHLKIEVSPRWLYERDQWQVDEDLQLYAWELLKSVKPVGVAIHLAVDFQGWEPPHDFDAHFVTRARKVACHNGLSELRFEGLDGAMAYGRRSGFTFGKPGGLQFCLYNKSEEVDVSDKRDFMESIWRTATNEKTFPETCYDPEKPVWRLEIRIHQKIINEIWQGTGLDPIYQYTDAVKHLTGLWQYALKNNRYEVRKGWVHPIWSKLRDDIGFGHSAPDLLYKRAKKRPGCGNEKNVQLAFGNLLSIYARNHFNPQQAWDCLKRSGLWDDLCEYYRRRDITSAMLYELVRESLLRRRLLGKVAA